MECRDEVASSASPVSGTAGATYGSSSNMGADGDVRCGCICGTEQGKKNIFSGRVLEIEGLENLKCEQAFELSDASAERSAAGCTIKLNPEPIKEYMTSNMVMLKWMLSEGYGDKRTIERRIASMQVRQTTWVSIATPCPDS